MRSFFYVTLLLSTFVGYGQNRPALDQSKVDSRVELMSIVFRLAESEEYMSNAYKVYVDKIEEFYTPHKNHELISYIKSLRLSHSIGYDAVMSMAIHMDKNYKLLKNYEKSLDKRWDNASAEKFNLLLHKFYKDTNSQVFFKNNENLYTQIEQNFMPVYKELDLNWYTQFYGKEPIEKFTIVNGLGNGGGNYGPNIHYGNEKREIYAIMGTWLMDEKGMPTFPLDRYFPTLLHEFNHSFVNHLLDDFEINLKDNGEAIYLKQREEMKTQAYSNWKIMLNEALVRAAVIKYMKDHRFDELEIANETSSQLERGFIWIEDLVKELEMYEKKRTIYPTLESYMPQLVEAYKRFADKLPMYQKRLDEMRPNVTEIDNLPHNGAVIDASTTGMRIHFDRPLVGKGRSFSLGPKGKEAFPAFEGITYGKDNRSFTLVFKLEPGKEYQFVITGLSFKTVEGISMTNHLVEFSTATY